MKIEIMLPTLSIAHIIRYQPMKWNSIHLKRETIPNPRFLGYLSRMFSQYALQLIDIEQNQVQALIRKKKILSRKFNQRLQLHSIHQFCLSLIYRKLLTLFYYVIELNRKIFI